MVEKGILNINKPQDMTSFDVVAIVRKKLGVPRVGHLGTLDPMAQGVLPIAFGKATRIMDYLDGDIKEYRAKIKFGLATDTDDIWGEVISKAPCQNVSLESIRECLQSFTGTISQIPPKYSALKVRGKKLYEYAREGKDAEIKPRTQHIFNIDIVSFDEENCELELQIACSKGTYIRSIARDLGESLGSAGTLSGLTRTGSGNFNIEDAISLDELRNMELEELEQRILPCDFALNMFGEIELGDWESKLFRNGVNLRRDQWEPAKEPKYLAESFPLDLDEIYKTGYRVYNQEGFLGVGKKIEDGILKADKILI